MRRRAPPPSLHGEIQHVFDGADKIGVVVRIGAEWKALARGGINVGLFDAAIEARRAVLQRHRAAMVPA